MLKPNFVFMGPKTLFNLASKTWLALFNGKSVFFIRPIFVSFFDKSKYFAPPQTWSKEKWLELINSKNNLLKSEWARP